MGLHFFTMLTLCVLGIITLPDALKEGLDGGSGIHYSLKI